MAVGRHSTGARPLKPKRLRLGAVTLKTIPCLPALQVEPSHLFAQVIATHGHHATVHDVTTSPPPADLAAADAIILGSPVYRNRHLCAIHAVARRRHDWPPAITFDAHLGHMPDQVVVYGRTELLGDNAFSGIAMRWKPLRQMIVAPPILIAVCCRTTIWPRPLRKGNSAPERVVFQATSSVSGHHWPLLAAAPHGEPGNTDP
jgi:hypothetical protein